MVSILTAKGLPRIAGWCGGVGDVGQVVPAPETQRQGGGKGPPGETAEKETSYRGTSVGKWEKSRRNRNFYSCPSGNRNFNSFIAISKFLSLFIGLIIFFNIVLLMAFIEE